MAAAVFADGVPAKITADDFRRYHLMTFPKLAEDPDGIISDAIDTVYAMFTGVATLWDMQPPQVWYDKTVTCYRLLTAWYITDSYPEVSAAYSSLNGMPLRRKKVDGVDLTFATEVLQDGRSLFQAAQDPLNGLKSNDFGRKALLMLRSSGKKPMLRSKIYVPCPAGTA
jgi:hypothetical protein